MQEKVTDLTEKKVKILKTTATMVEPTQSSLCGKRPRRLLHDNIWPLSFFCLLPSILLSQWSTYTTSATATLAFQLNDGSMISNTCDYHRRPCHQVMRTSVPSSPSPPLLLLFSTSLMDTASASASTAATGRRIRESGSPRRTAYPSDHCASARRRGITSTS